MLSICIFYSSGLISIDFNVSRLSAFTVTYNYYCLTLGYVGLVNQAMTCYLNSLLQALFMTPEFRNALYKWQFDSSNVSDPAKCIPFQLQKLFLNLQVNFIINVLVLSGVILYLNPLTQRNE